MFRREENAEVHRGPQTSSDDGDDDFLLGDPSVANGDVGTLVGDKQAAKDIGCSVSTAFMQRFDHISIN